MSILRLAFLAAVVGIAALVLQGCEDGGSISFQAHSNGSVGVQVPGYDIDFDCSSVPSDTADPELKAKCDLNWNPAPAPSPANQVPSPAPPPPTPPPCPPAAPADNGGRPKGGCSCCTDFSRVQCNSFTNKCGGGSAGQKWCFVKEGACADQVNGNDAKHFFGGWYSQLACEAEFVDISVGNCAGQGYHSVDRADKCEEAARATGWFKRPPAVVRESHAHRPEGCHRSSSDLYLNVHRCNGGNGKSPGLNQLCSKAPRRMEAKDIDIQVGSSMSFPEVMTNSTRMDSLGTSQLSDLSTSRASLRR